MEWFGWGGFPCEANFSLFVLLPSEFRDFLILVLMKMAPTYITLELQVGAVVYTNVGGEAEPQNCYFHAHKMNCFCSVEDRCACWPPQFELKIRFI